MMIPQYIKFLYENNITYAELTILLYLNEQISNTDFYNYVKLFETREENYVYDRININIVYDLLKANLIELKTKDDTFVTKLTVTIDKLLSSYKPTKEGKILLKKFTDIFSNMLKASKLVSTENTLSLLDTICAYWYDERGVPYKSAAINDKGVLESAFKKYREENPDHDDGLIVKAVHLYFEEYKKRNCKIDVGDGIVNYQYLTSQLDFITSDKTYSLKNFCKNSKNSNVLIAKNIISLD